MQQIAAWLFSNPVTEELVHDLDSAKGKSGSDETQLPYILHAYHERAGKAESGSLLNHLHDEALFLRHSDDILSPPPNI